MFETNVYLRCEKGHANTILMSERHARVGTRCNNCGSPLLAEAPSERGAYRGRF